MRFVPSAEFRAMPWKNGLGVTREVALGGDAATFDWRVSIATVGASGPFSAFPGIDRTIAVLKGEGMLLNVDGARHELLAAGEPFSFAGEAKVHADCIGGETTDLNIMTRRASFAHVMTRRRPAEPFTFTGPAGLTFLICNGPFRLEIAGKDHAAQPLDAVCDIAEGDRLRIEPQGQADLFQITVGQAPH
ncbi:HutD/Ves family protein [Ollibium composti]|uniref:HutD family protein n=1 Tax=Ollibium composti TaxID=2675109 RepID=A0ABY2QBT5_9HYPH|nr:HutD family protein [Mesorhizobium composti]THF59148.1 HutD family protein [Mesorhizobium composti]